MLYQTPIIRDFGSIATHTFQTGDAVDENVKMTTGPGHVDAHAECSGGTGGGSYPTPCEGKGGTYD